MDGSPRDDRQGNRQDAGERESELRQGSLPKGVRGGGVTMDPLTNAVARLASAIQCGHMVGFAVEKLAEELRNEVARQLQTLPPHGDARCSNPDCGCNKEE